MDKPILFSGPMVRALLDGRNTMTRRILKPQPKVLKNGVWYQPFRLVDPYNWTYVLGDKQCGWLKLPIAIGVRMWVREACAIVPASAYHMSEGVRQTMSPTDPDLAAIYRTGWDRSGSQKWRPSIHMPRWASRLTLMVTDVKVERLQNITPADAIREGIAPAANCATIDCDTPNPVDDFRALWESINGPGSWEANPWVAAYSFEVHRCNIDRMPALPASREG